MARKTKIEIEFEAVTSEFSNGIKQMNGDIKSLNKELKLNTTQLKEDANNVDLLKERQRLLGEELAKSNEKVELTNQKLEEAKKYFGEDSDKVRQLKNELTDAKNQQQAISNAIHETNQKIIVQTEKSLTLGKSMQEIGGKIENTGSKIENLGNKLSIVSGATATIGGISIKTVASFESSMRKVAATMGITAKEIEQGSEDYRILEEAAQKCGETTKYSASEAAEGLNYLALAGYDARKSAEVLPKVLNLAAAGDLELATASDMVTDAMAALNMETKDLDKYINEMAKTSQKSNTNVAQLGEATLTVAGTAKLANMSLETMNAELGILANNGIKGAEGGTHLRNIILSLTSPTDVAADALKKLGINVADSKGNVRDLNDIMSDFNKKLDGMSDEKKTNIISSIFNKTDISAVNALIKGSGSEFTNLKNEITNCGNAAQDMADVMNSSFEGELTLLKSQLESNAIAIGKKLIPVAKDGIKVIADLSTKFSKLTDEQVKSVVKTGAFVVALGPAVKIGGKLISTTGSAVKSIGTLIKAVGVFRTGISSGIQSVDNLAGMIGKIMSPAGLATAAVVALAGGLVYLALKESDAEKKAKELLETTKEQKVAFDEHLETIDKTMQSNIAQIDNSARLKDELLTLVDANGKVKEGYKNRVDFILNELNGALETEYKLNGDLIENYQELQKEIDTTIKKKKAQVILAAEEEKAKEAVKEETEASKTLKEAVDELGMSYQDASSILKEYQDKIDNAYDGTASGYGEVLALKKEFKEKMGLEIETVENLVSSYDMATEDIKKSIETRKQYESDYALALEEKYDEIGSTVTTTTEEIKNSSISNLREQIETQSKDLDTYSEMYKNTQSEVAKSNEEVARKNLQNLADELEKRTSTVETLGEEEKNAWKTLATEAYDVYAEKVQKIGGTTATQIQLATGVIVGEIPYVQQVANDYINTVIEALDKDEQFRKEAVDSLNSYLSGLTDEQKRELLKQAGIQDADKVADGLKEGKQLSEQQGVEILRGLKTGLQNNPEIASAVTQACKIASRIAGAFAIDVPSIISKSTSNIAQAGVLPGHANGLNYVPYDNYVARLHKGERVLTAKENEEYNKTFGVQGILNSRVNRSITNNQTTNNRNIVVQFYPQQMTNSEIERAFTYIDRRYGQYMP